MTVTVDDLERFIQQERDKQKQQAEKDPPQAQPLQAQPPASQFPQALPGSGGKSEPSDILDDHLRSALLDGIGPEDLELTGDTVNPSAMFDDKSQAEWFGNIVNNASKDAFKGIISQAQKIPRWVWILVLAAGAMLGFIGALWLMGGVAGHATTTAVTTRTTASISIPPPPNFNATTTATG
jgi:hypothetical protein